MWNPQTELWDSANPQWIQEPTDIYYRRKKKEAKEAHEAAIKQWEYEHRACGSQFGNQWCGRHINHDGVHAGTHGAVWTEEDAQWYKKYALRLIKTPDSS